MFFFDGLAMTKTLQGTKKNTNLTSLRHCEAPILSGPKQTKSLDTSED